MQGKMNKKNQTFYPSLLHPSMETFQTTQKQISEFDKLSNNIGLAQIEQYWGELIQTLRIMKIRSSQGCNDIDTQGIYLKNIQEYWRQYQKSLSEVL